MDNNKDRFELSEMFMAQADRHRRFYGTIQRSFDADGVPVVYGKIKVLDGFIIAQAGTSEELGERLDELVKMVVDKGLHESGGVTSEIANTTYFLN